MSRRSRIHTLQNSIILPHGPPKRIYQPQPYDNKAVRFNNDNTEELDGDTYASSFAFDNTDAFSVVFWFFMDDSDLDADTGYIIDNRDSTTGARWYVYLDQDTELRFYLYDGTTAHALDLQTVNYHQDLYDEHWHCFIATHDASNNTAWYIDGSLELTGSWSPAGSSTMGGSVFHIGNSYSTGDAFDGLLGPVAVYSVDLGLDDVKAIYNEGTTIDLTSGPHAASLEGYWRMGEGDSGTTISDNSGNGRDLTMTNLSVSSDVEDATLFSEGYIATPQTPGLKCVEFLAIDEKLENTALATTLSPANYITKYRGLSIAFWMRATGAISSYHDILWYGTNTSSNGILIEKYSTAGFYWTISSSSTLTHTSICFNAHMEAAGYGWELHVFTYVSREGNSQTGQRRYWCNGLQRTTGTPSTDTNSQFADPERVTVGHISGNARICNLSIWLRWLSRSEVRRLYNNGHPTNVPLDFPEDLIHHWPLGDHPDDTFSTFKDVVNGCDLTSTNMDASNLVTDHPSNPT